MKSYMYGVQGAFLAVSLCTVCAANTCTDLGNLPFLKNGYTWAGSPFMNLTTGGLMLCAVECIKRSRCMSFNFYLQDGSCEMRDVETSVPRLWEERHASVVVGSLPDSQAYQSTRCEFQRGTQLLARTCEFHDCDVHETCIPEDGGYSCAMEFPSSCAEVKQCAPKSGDGEYWIYLRDFNMVKAHIYCHNMASTEPADYLTLPVTNYGYYPILRNPICAGEVAGLAGSCYGNGGEVWFNKIKIDTRSLRVTTNDHRFANYTNSKLLYGAASDCYAKHNDGVKASCGPRGTFTIDLSGTGMAVTPETTWLDTGYKYWMNVTRADDNTRVYMNCGGYPGFCEAEDGLFLQPYNMDALKESSATEVQCAIQ